LTGAAASEPYSRSEVSRPLRSILAAVAATTILGGCALSGPAQPGVTYARYEFTCCLASDTGQTWRSGQAVELHWIVQGAGETADDKRRSVVLTATVTGPYKDVATLKAQGPAARTVAADRIATDDRTPTVPVSVLPLPVDLPPGFYNLAVKVDLGGGTSMESASVVQVGSP
jgi:hypothetical protein